MFIATHHAAQRFTERFAGNLSETAARTRIEKIAQKARYVKEMPGHAKLYTTKNMAFVVKEHTIMTVYQRSAAICQTQTPYNLRDTQQIPGAPLPSPMNQPLELGSVREVRDPLPPELFIQRRRMG